MLWPTKLRAVSTQCQGQMTSADGFKMTRVLQGEETKTVLHAGKKTPLEKVFAACHVLICRSLYTLYVSHWCVVPLPWQVFWLRWVGHPGRAAVRGWRWHDKVIWVTRTVGWYSVDCCYWVSCEMKRWVFKLIIQSYWSQLLSSFKPCGHTWVGGDGLIDSDGREGSSGQRQEGGAIELLRLQVWSLGHTWLQTNIRGGAFR